jgi:hypothetical protein
VWETTIIAAARHSGARDDLLAEALDCLGFDGPWEREEDALDTDLCERADVVEDLRRFVELAASWPCHGEPGEPLDLVEIPADLVAMPSQDVHLVPEHLGVGRSNVARVGVLGDEA